MTLEKPNGFAGSMEGLPLADVLQLKALNLYSGCMGIEYASKKGYIFFMSGEIIHAVLGHDDGEKALYQILTWPGGQFTVEPSMTADRRSINKSVTYLLLEACRLMDESAKNASPAREERRVAPRIPDRIKTIGGVSSAALFDANGVMSADDGFDSALSARLMPLIKAANDVGGLFGIGDVKVASVEGGTEQAVLFESRGTFLAVSVKAGHQMAKVETDIRAIFTPRR